MSSSVKPFAEFLNSFKVTKTAYFFFYFFLVNKLFASLKFAQPKGSARTEQLSAMKALCPSPLATPAVTSALSLVVSSSEVSHCCSWLVCC